MHHAAIAPATVAQCRNWLNTGLPSRSKMASSRVTSPRQRAPDEPGADESFRVASHSSRCVRVSRSEAGRCGQSACVPHHRGQTRQCAAPHYTRDAIVRQRPSHLESELHIHLDVSAFADQRGIVGQLGIGDASADLGPLTAKGRLDDFDRLASVLATERVEHLLIVVGHLTKTRLCGLHDLALKVLAETKPGPHVRPSG